jgi:hypothetical protein
MRGVRGILGAVALLALLSACASDKGPAEQAIKGAKAAVAQARTEAAKWMPAETQALEASLASVKDKFAKGAYKAVLAEAPGIAAWTKDLAAAAAAEKAKLAKSWEEMSAGLPTMVEAIKSRVDILSKSKKVPANVSKEKFDVAKADLADATKGWDDTTAAYKGGNVVDTVAKATAVKTKAVEALEALGMPVPPAAKS